MEIKSIIELKINNTLFEEIVIPSSVHTVEDVQEVCKCMKSEVIKTLLFVGRSPIIVVMTGDKKVDLEKLKKIRNDNSLRMASKMEVNNITGFSVGSVSPFGLPKNLEMIADQAVENLTVLIMGSGKNDMLLKMSQLEFSKSFRGSYLQIAL